MLKVRMFVLAVPGLPLMLSLVLATPGSVILFLLMVILVAMFFLARFLLLDHKLHAPLLLALCVVLVIPTHHEMALIIV